VGLGIEPASGRDSIHHTVLSTAPRQILIEN